MKSGTSKNSLPVLPSGKDSNYCTSVKVGEVMTVDPGPHTIIIFTTFVVSLPLPLTVVCIVNE